MTTDGQTEAAATGRERTVRHGPVALLCGVGLLGCAALLLPRVLTLLGGGIPAWPGWLVRSLAAVRATDGWLLGGGGLFALTGAAMVVLALTPGTRWERTRHPVGARVRARLDRRGVGALLRETALRVPGVAGARVRVRGRRAVVRAVLAFGDPAEAYEALIAELGARRDRLGLVRPPRLVVRIAPAGCRMP